MITRDIEVRVRYGEVDQMGFLYHAHYVSYYDMGRNELIRSFGITQRDLEESDNIMIPVLNVNINYITPAYFDDVLTVRTILKEVPRVKMKFYTEIYKNDILINYGDVTLAFMNANTKKAVRPPQRLLDAIKAEF